MAAIVTTNKNGTCGICLEDFHPQEEQLTHLNETGGVVGHEGFHKRCLIQWLNHRPTCPHDNTPLDVSSIRRIDRIMAKLRPALINAAYTAPFQLATVGAAVAALKAIGVNREEMFAIIATGIAASVRIVHGRLFAGSTGVILGVTTQLLEIDVGTRKKIAAITATATAAGGIVGEAANWILDRRGIDSISRASIASGMLIGAAATTLPLFNKDKDNISLQAIALGSLAGSVAAGIVSLINN